MSLTTLAGFHEHQINLYKAFLKDYVPTAAEFRDAKTFWPLIHGYKRRTIWNIPRPKINKLNEVLAMLMKGTLGSIFIFHAVNSGILELASMEDGVKLCRVVVEKGLECKTVVDPVQMLLFARIAITMCRAGITIRRSYSCLFHAINQLDGTANPFKMANHLNGAYAAKYRMQMIHAVVDFCKANYEDFKSAE